MVLLDLFKVPSYSFGSGIGLVYFAGFTAIFFILALYLQNGAGYSALQTGLAVTPFALGSAVASAFGGRVVHRLGRPLVAAGLAVVIVGLLVTDLVLAHVSGPNVGWAIVGAQWREAAQAQAVGHDEDAAERRLRLGRAGSRAV